MGSLRFVAAHVSGGQSDRSAAAEKEFALRRRNGKKSRCRKNELAIPALRKQSQKHDQVRQLTSKEPRQN
jgi:hypothetical protein